MMLILRRFALFAALCFSLGFLAACDNAEERAEEHYHRGLALLEEGDVDRALVEFRNVFKLNGKHREARLIYAQTVEGRGNQQEAFGQYLRLVEQYPEDFEGRRALSRLALAVGNWDEVERHVEVAKRLQPEDLLVRAVATAVDYRAAVLGQDFTTAHAVAGTAAELVAMDPVLVEARRLVIDNMVRREEWPEALEQTDAALTHAPEDRAMHMLRISLLERLGQEAEIETHLKAMVELFDGDDSMHNLLVQWYVTRQLNDEAEAYLRERIAAEPETDRHYANLVAFLIRFQGPEAAQAEIAHILAESDADRALFRSMSASLDFDLGRRDAAIAEMEDILKDAVPSDQTHRIKVALANMLIQTDNPVGARAQVEAILAEDATHVAALKLKAGWLIDDDRTGDAIIELRRALDQSPRDAELMTILARAYERAGNRELMTEMLSLAVEASGAAPAESLRYANLLLGENKLLPAEDVLLAALRAQPGNAELLAVLGNVHIRQEDWPRAEQVINTLQRLDSERAIAIANELKARRLAGQNKQAELGAFLNDLAEQDGRLQSVAAVVRLRLANGDTQGALDYVNEHRADDPDNPALKFVAATVLAIQGQIETAVMMLEELVQEEPNRDNVWIALYNLHRSRGETEAAVQALERGLDAAPDSRNLNWVQASEMEFSGDIEGAIAIYEELYARDSNSLVIANNLASLISSYRSDQESLERAFTIARRLRGSNVAQFQDTYGWIAHRLGNHDEALGYLESAVEGIPNDALVRRHLAQVYIALNRKPEALEQLQRGLALIEETGRRPEIRSKLEADVAALEASAGEVAPVDGN